MDPVTVTTSIARPREEVFDYLADVANHAEFCDHFLVDWHLTREDTLGRGAGARFRIRQRFNRFARGEITFIDVERPRRLVAAGRGGRYNRVELEVESQPGILSDRLLEGLLGARRFARRRYGKALRRLRAILEEGEQRGARATISGGARKPATGFRL